MWCNLPCCDLHGRYGHRTHQFGRLALVQLLRQLIDFFLQQRQQF